MPNDDDRKSPRRSAPSPKAETALGFSPGRIRRPSDRVGTDRDRDHPGAQEGRAGRAGSAKRERSHHSGFCTDAFAPGCGCRSQGWWAR
jgi:hypothetical protein